MGEIEFKKVSFEEYKKSCVELGHILKSDAEYRFEYDSIPLPRRSTSQSAGYDFFAPFTFFVSNDIKDNEHTALVPTGIRVKMPNNVCLLLAPRSGIGTRTGTHLANTTGVIDPDYYSGKNEGHIMAKLVGGFDSLMICKNDRFMQGIFVPFLLTDNDSATESRQGGFGSTGV